MAGRSPEAGAGSSDCGLGGGGAPQRGHHTCIPPLWLHGLSSPTGRSATLVPAPPQGHPGVWRGSGHPTTQVSLCSRTARPGCPQLLQWGGATPPGNPPLTVKEKAARGRVGSANSDDVVTGSPDPKCKLEYLKELSKCLIF